MAPRILPQWCWASLRGANATTTAAAIEATTTSIQTSTAAAAAGCTLLQSSGKAVEGRRGVKYGWSNTLPRRGVRPDRYNAKTVGLPPPTTGPAAALKRKEGSTPLRTGVLATKRGMTGFYTNRGTRIPCTVLQLENVQVVANKTFKGHGYWAVQIGSGVARPTSVTAPLLGYFEAKGLPPKEHLAEFRVRNASGLLTPGVTLQPDWFHVGQFVDVRSNSRGFGFAGGMKKHGFSGQNASHGNSLNHRTMGSTGASQGSGSRVLPGKKMPGRMGNERVTIQNLFILHIDNELGIVVVKGPVGGPKGALVKIQDSLKKPPPSAEFIEEKRNLVMSRNPDAAAQLQAARVRHLELKEARREGRIAELLSGGLSNPSIADDAIPEEESPVVPDIPVADLAPEQPPAQPTA